MRLFMFYPNDYCRMYVVASNIEEVRERAEELFLTYMTEQYNSWLDVDDPDEDCYIQEKRADFMAGINNTREIESGVVIDSHY
jgi:SMC interacting uncharacterized protein involved in chromosome segregation